MHSRPAIRNIRRNTQDNNSSSCSNGIPSNVLLQILITFVLACASFYVGVLSGVQMGTTQIANKNGCDGSSSSSSFAASDAVIGVDRAALEIHRNWDSVENGGDYLTLEEEKEVERLVKERVQAELSKLDDADAAVIVGDASKSQGETSLFPSTMESFIAGSAYINKLEFTSMFDLGVPIDENGPGYKDALIFYNDKHSIPSSPLARNDGAKDIPTLPTKDALQNCDSLNVILTRVPGQGAQCMAIMQNYQSYHIHRWMRADTKQNQRNALDAALPLRHISRGQATNGKDNFDPPSKRDILSNFKDLEDYMKYFDEVSSELTPILKRVADDKKTVIVLTCNQGQSDLLMNFACSARARGLEDVLKHVLVFPTDLETKALAEGLGLATYFDERNFGKLPSKEARQYADRTFTAMMFAKVVCVQLVNFLGFNLLFQDVDIVWYKNPLTYFNDEEKSGDFDVYFQDDGQHSVRYAPYSANSGFYYVRHNARTRYLFTTVLYYGDMIKAWGSHQQALVAVLTDHASYYGLRVKVLGRDENEFPGGFHYHRRRDYMKQLVQQENKDAYIFHMSWTTNKDNKLKFFQQMGEWYLNERCAKGNTFSDIVGDDVMVNEQPLVGLCCLAEPNIVCHYSDKPSKIPCKDSPKIDKGGRPFW